MGLSGLAAGRQVQRHRAKLSCPLLDRIGIQIDMPAVTYKELAGAASGEASVAIRERVNAARQRRLARFGDTRGTFCNAQMESADLRRFCELDLRGHDLLELAMTKLGLSARAHDRVLKVARTIADLDRVEGIRPKHISQAIQYRSLDRSPWGGEVRDRSLARDTVVSGQLSVLVDNSAFGSHGHLPHCTVFRRHSSSRVTSDKGTGLGENTIGCLGRIGERKESLRGKCRMGSR